MPKKHTGKAPETQSIPVPTTKEQLQSIICEGNHICEGNCSLINNLPHPEVRTLDNHAYVLPSECIANLLAHGTMTSTMAVQSTRYNHWLNPGSQEKSLR